ncbi:MAG TPA: glycosyltransferase [Candidatus Eisenbacteria bacterium]|nr:glycosyltransferase [Candidatus Eisenbacteria bacterium]
MKVLVVTNMYPSAERPHWGAFVRSQVESLVALGVENVIYEIEGWKSTARYANAMRELPVLARRAGADLVHAHYGLSGAAAVGVREIPLVVSFCGDDLLGRPDAKGRITSRSKWLVSVSRLAARRADAVIVKTEEMRRTIPDVHDVEVIPNGVDLERFTPVPRDQARAKLGWPIEGQVLLFAAATDEPRKNWPLALEVEKRLTARGLPARLVAFHGRPQEELALAMSAADLLLLPSIHEGSPNVVKEALACDLPVVAAPVGDCAERLKGVTPGGVVAREPGAFAEAAEAVLRAGTRSNGREKVAPLEIMAVARRILAVYERALSARPA